MAVVFGTSGNDNLSTEASDIIFGQDGNDTLVGGGDPVTLLGGEGEDRLVTGGGGGFIDGGAGNDTLVAGDGDTVIISGSGDNLIETGGGTATVSLGSGNNTVTAGDGDLLLTSEGGNNTVTLGGGNANVQLGTGDDVIVGGSGSATINGGGGNDTIVLKDGDYVITGGTGTDTYVYDDNTSGDIVINDFKAGEDTLDLKGLTGVTDVGQLDIEQQGDNVVVKIGDNTIVIGNATVSDVQTAIEVACFHRGTMIRTPGGDRAVETLAIGDRVTTIDGVARPIKWIGYRAFKSRFVGQSKKVVPIRIEAGAIADNVPSKPLLLSPGHSLYVDGLLVNADLLVNGTSVRQELGSDLIEYYHIELETPDVIFANDAPSETYVNDENRPMFLNWQEYEGLYGPDEPALRDEHNAVLHRFRYAQAGEELKRLRDAVAARSPKADMAAVA